VQQWWILRHGAKTPILSGRPDPPFVEAPLQLLHNSITLLWSYKADTLFNHLLNQIQQRRAFAKGERIRMA
jgi:hypothetical protein